MRRFLCAVGMIGVTVPLPAQPPQQPQNQQIPPPYEETVVVTASIPPEEIEQAAPAVDFVGRREIEARQATSVAELVATLPGVTVVRSGPPGQPTSAFIRGAESDQTLVLWNGVELNDPFFGAFDWAFLPTEGVERVEVVRGPSSALYGSQAVGGVVQVITTGSPGGGRLRLEVGEHAYRRGSLAAAGALGDALWLDIAGHARRGESEFDNGDHDGDEATLALDWRPADGAGLGLVARWNESASGIPFAGGLPSPERRIAWRESQVAVPASLEVGGWSLEGRLAALDFERAFRDPADPFGFTFNDTDASALRARATATRPLPTSRLGGDSWIALGGEWEELEASDRSTFGVNLDAADQATVAAFGQAHLAWREARLDVGVRHDDNDVYGSQLSPRLGVVWALGAGTRLRAAWGEGFRAPSLGELFFPGSGNAELEPETSESWELGVEHRAGRLLVALAAFENRQRNLIDFDFLTFSNVNLGRARSRGVELSLLWEGRRWRSRLAATALDAEDLDADLPLLRRPDGSASWSLTARPGPWTASLVARWVGERPDIDPASFARAVNPSYTAVDLALSRDVGRWAPYLRLENATDRRYREALGFPAPGRTVIGGVALEWR